MKGRSKEEKQRNAETRSYFMVGRAIGFIIIWGLSIYSSYSYIEQIYNKNKLKAIILISTFIF